MRPAAAGCYIAAEFLEDWQKCKNFASLGLQANPSDIGLQNNLALAEAALGNFDAAETLLDAASQKSNDAQASVILKSTRGFLFYRKGDYITGAKFYEEANRLATLQKNNDLIQRSALHWMQEEMFLGNIPNRDIWSKLSAVMSNTKQTSASAKDFFDVVLKPFWIKEHKEDVSQLARPNVFSPSLLLPPNK